MSFFFSFFSFFFLFLGGLNEQHGCLSTPETRVFVVVWASWKRAAAGDSARFSSYSSLRSRKSDEEHT